MSLSLQTNDYIMVKITNLLSDRSRGIQIKSSRDYISLSRKGLSFRQLKEILKYTRLTMKEIGNIISLSERQLSRYKDDKILKTDTSAHLIQIVELYQKGYDVLESEDNFHKWMKSEIRSLGYQRPIDLLDTPFGIQEVKNTLGRLEHGVYS